MPEGVDNRSAARAVYLGLGSNLGDRAANLRAALDALKRHGIVTAVSSLYETAPVGVTDQPYFCNAVCLLNTALLLPDLLSAVKGIEWELGRRPGVRWGPRPIDIDILLAGNETLDEPVLTVPHVRLSERAFVLVPLAEIAPSAVHPTLSVSVQELLEALPAGEVRSVTRIEGRRWCIQDGQ